MIALAELWRSLGSAFGLCLVLEGLLPFMNPAASKRYMAQLVRIEPQQLRRLALLWIAFGLVVLWAVRRIAPA